MPNEPHAIARARERYGIELVVADLVEIKRMIGAGEAVLIRDHAGEPTRRWLVRIRGMTMIACAGRNEHHIVTILPPPSHRKEGRISGDKMKKDRREIRRGDHKARRSGHRGKRRRRIPETGGHHDDAE